MSHNAAFLARAATLIMRWIVRQPGGKNGQMGRGVIDMSHIRRFVRHLIPWKTEKRVSPHQLQDWLGCARGSDRLISARLGASPSRTGRYARASYRVSLPAPRQKQRDAV